MEDNPRTRRERKEASERQAAGLPPLQPAPRTPARAPAGPPGVAQDDQRERQPRGRARGATVTTPPATPPRDPTLRNLARELGESTPGGAVVKNVVNAKLVVTEMQACFRELKPLVERGEAMMGDFRGLLDELRDLLGPLANPAKMQEFSDLVGGGVPVNVALSQVMTGAGSSAPEDSGERG